MLTVRPPGGPFVLLFSLLTHFPGLFAGSVVARTCAAEPRGLFVTSEMCIGAICLRSGERCPTATVVIGLLVVFRTGVNPVRTLLRARGVDSPNVLSSRGSIVPSLVKPCAGTLSSMSSARRLPSVEEVGCVSSSGERFESSGVRARRKTGGKRRSGVFARVKAEVLGPDSARAREFGVKGGCADV